MRAFDVAMAFQDEAQKLGARETMQPCVIDLDAVVGVNVKTNYTHTDFTIFLGREQTQKVVYYLNFGSLANPRFLNEDHSVRMREADAAKSVMRQLLHAQRFVRGKEVGE